MSRPRAPACDSDDAMAGRHGKSEGGREGWKDRRMDGVGMAPIRWLEPCGLGIGKARLWKEKLPTCARPPSATAGRAPGQRWEEMASGLLHASLRYLQDNIIPSCHAERCRRRRGPLRRCDPAPGALGCMSLPRGRGDLGSMEGRSGFATALPKLCNALATLCKASLSGSYLTSDGEVRSSR